MFPYTIWFKVEYMGVYIRRLYFVFSVVFQSILNVFVILSDCYAVNICFNRVNDHHTSYSGQSYSFTNWKLLSLYMYDQNPLAIVLFVCVEVLRPSQPNWVMSSAVSLPNHTFNGQAYSSKRLTSIVHILSPETDNCPSWISGRKRMT